MENPSTTPNPSEVRPVGVHDQARASPRNLYCALYDHCLNVAVKRGWQDWTCRVCALANSGHAPSAAEHAHDRNRRES